LKLSRHFATSPWMLVKAKSTPLSGTDFMTEMKHDPRFPDVLIHQSSYVDDGAVVGRGTKIWHFCHVLSGTVIGDNCSIGQNAMIGPRVSIGNGCKIQNNVSLYEGVQLGDDVFCGPSCVFTNVINPRANVNRKAEFRATPVGRGVTIGANATIVCGHSLGEFCMIGAGAVVTKDVPAYALMVGNPARRMGWVSRAGERLGADLICPLMGERYTEISANELVLQ
jgi:UDP-2-acetamido-3-amino-2,3-dideoxy-glucuronate N-acetyltransferase